MKNIIKKFVALFMLLWLPLSAGSALAATIPMSLHDACQNMDKPTMQHQDMSAHLQHSGPMHPQHGISCSNCGDCHVTCSYLAVPTIELALLQQDGQAVTPYTVSFTSFISAPLDPPPSACT